MPHDRTDRAGPRRAAVALLWAAAAVAGWALWSGPAEPVAAPAERAGDGPASAGSASPATIPAAARQSVTSGGPTGGDAAGAGGETVISGRVVDAATGAPIAGARIALHGWPASDERVAAHPLPLRWVDPAPAVGGTDGTFALRCRPQPPFDFDFEIGAPGYAAAGIRWRSLRAGSAVDLGDVALRVGAPLRGVITDEGGRALSGIELRCWIELAFPGGAAAAHGGEPRQVEARMTSGGDGAFAGPAIARSGAVALELDTPGWRFVGAPPIALRDLPARVVLRPVAGRLAGVAVDRRGAPVGGVVVHAGEASATSDDAGRFTVLGDGRPGDEVELVVVSHARADDRPDVPLVPRWGDRDLRVIVRRRGEVVLRVLDAGGRPVERYRVEVRLERTSVPGRWDRAIGGHHPGGDALLEDLPPGRHALVVVPADGGRSAPCPLAVDEGARVVLVVRVRRPVAVRATVHDTAGRPVGGAALALHEEPKDPPLATARTAPDGRAELRVRPGHADLLLRVAADDGFVPATIRGIDVPAEPAPVRVVLSRGATVEVVVEPPGLARELRGGGSAGAATVALAPVGGDDSPPRLAGPVPLPDDGVFTFGRLPSGRWRLLLEWRTSTGWPVRWLGPFVDVAGEESLRLVADAREARPGRIAGRIRVGGEPLAGTVMWFTAADGVTRGFADATPDGRIEVSGVAPGAYRLVAYHAPSGGRAAAVPSPAPIVVEPGGAVDVSFAAACAPLRLRVCTVAGEPLADSAVVVVVAGTAVTIASGRTDAGGMLALASVGGGAYRVRVRGGALESAPFEVSGGAAAVERTVVVE